MIFRVLTSTGAVALAAQAVSVPDPGVQGFVVFGSIVGGILGGIKLIEWYFERRDRRNGTGNGSKAAWHNAKANQKLCAELVSLNKELAHFGECLDRVESAMNAQTTVMAAMGKWQEAAAAEITRSLGRIEDNLPRKVA